MNILIFSPIPVYPLDQGSSRRIYNFGQFLKQNNCFVHFVYFSNLDINRKEHLDLWDTYTFIKQENKQLKYMGTGGNTELDVLYEAGLGERVAKICEELLIDMVICNYIFQSKLLEFLPESIYKVIDTHDKFTDKYLLNKWFSFSQQEEAKGLNRADLVIAIQDNEASFFEKISNSKVITISHIESEKFLEKEYSTPLKVGILSSGHLQDKVSTEELLNYYIDQNNSKSLDFEIYLAGNICNKISISHKKIHKLFFVDDLHSFYDNMDIIVSPPMKGTGLKIKTVEALAYGVPVVSTSVGFEGIQTSNIYHNCINVKNIVDVLIELSKGNVKNNLKSLEKSSHSVFETYAKTVEQNISKMLNYASANKKTNFEHSDYQIIIDKYNSKDKVSKTQANYWISLFAGSIKKVVQKYRK